MKIAMTRLSSMLCLAFVAFATGGEASLYDEFVSPPRESRPQVFWWFDASVPEAAITRDLEGLARAGVSGFQVYSIHQDSCAPDNFMGSPLWIRKVKWSLHEANRLGLDGIVSIGGAACGHPLTDPRYAQKDLVSTTVNQAGGGTIRVKLPKKGVKETPKRKDGSPKYYWDIATLAVPASHGFLPVSKVRNVSQFLNRETDEFVWPDAPAGDWRILRFGYVPKVFGWMGCYIDHMSRAAFDAHWQRVVVPLLVALDAGERRALKAVQCDSWEAGTVSWTETFAEEFKRLNGYDLTPWLPVKAGVKLETPELSERFRRDYAETISTLIAENHYAYQKEVANRHGMISIAEAAGPHQRQGDVRRMQGRCDVAMGEFWMPSPHRPTPPQRFMVRDAASAAHVYGISEVLAEAFTGRTHWTNYPENMKPCADRAFCDGFTRTCFHGTYISPSLADRPGDVYAWGTHYNPQNTWFEQSKAFNLYLSRCGWMLSRGKASMDCLLFASGAINVFTGMKRPSDGLGVGYDYDICPTELLLRARVENGEIVLPSGVRYKALKFCDINPRRNNNLNPGRFRIREYPPVAVAFREDEMLKFRELVEAGATLVGARPVGPTSMNDSSARYHAAADVLWGPRGSVQPARRKVGRGLVLRDSAEARKLIAPDFVTDKPLDWIHRKVGEGDVYFLSNQQNESVHALVRLRDCKGSVELWDPVTCERRAATLENGALQLDLPSYGSLFVVSSLGADGGPATDRKAPLSPRGPAVPIQPVWRVAFDPKWGGPAEPVEFNTLVDWTRHVDVGIKYYSGTAIYTASFDAPTGCRSGTSISLDLGEVKNVAEVILNGENLGVVWTKPFAVRTSKLKAKDNILEVRVTNLWPNRLIRDAGLPEAERLTKTNYSPYKPTDPLLPSGLLGPVTVSGEALFGDAQP